MAEEDNSGEKAIWFLAGVAVGAGLGILFAPKAGRETRQYLSEKTAEGREYLAEHGQRLFEKGKELVEDLGEMAERGRKAVERAKTGTG